MANTERVSLYMTDAERLALRRAAERIDSSENYVLKLLVRHHFGMPLSELQEAQLHYALPRAQSTV